MAFPWFFNGFPWFQASFDPNPYHSELRFTHMHTTQVSSRLRAGVYQGVEGEDARLDALLHHLLEPMLRAPRVATAGTGLELSDEIHDSHVGVLKRNT